MRFGADVAGEHERAHTAKVERYFEHALAVPRQQQAKS